MIKPTHFSGVLSGQHGRHGHTPLLLAVLGNHVCCAEALLCGGARPGQDAHGTPALHHAAERCGERMVSLLLEALRDVKGIKGMKKWIKK